LTKSGHLSKKTLEGSMAIRNIHFQVNNFIVSYQKLLHKINKFFKHERVLILTKKLKNFFLLTFHFTTYYNKLKKKKIKIYDVIFSI
jgi:hypothetical protein